MVSRDKPSTVNQQRKAMGPRLVEKCACTVALHGCHPQSQSHPFQEKENDTCTFKTDRLLIVRTQKHKTFLEPTLPNILTNIPTTKLSFNVSHLGFNHKFYIQYETFCNENLGPR